MDKFQQAQTWLTQLSSEAKFFRAGELPTLDTVNEILEALGRPDESFAWRVVIGGTAGKGSTCRMIENTLQSQGIKTATLVSPHLQVITERIRIDGKLIAPEDFGKNILKIKETAEKLNVNLTYYETMVLAGILAAKEADVEVLIGEIGMGGWLDAVNAVQGKRIAGLTFVGADHLEFFENKIEKLAEEKAGIFTTDSVLNLSFEQKYCSILEQVAQGKVKFLKGIPAKLNKKMARKICEKILGHTDFTMEKIKMPARWEKLSSKDVPTGASTQSTIILDGAHAADRFQYLLPKLKKESPTPSLNRGIHSPTRSESPQKIGIFAMARNHGPESFKIMFPYFDTVIWTEVPGERDFWRTKDLANICKDMAMLRLNQQTEKDPLKALQKAQEMDGKIFVLGSFYLCGKIREQFYPSDEILKQQTEFPKAKR